MMRFFRRIRTALRRRPLQAAVTWKSIEYFDPSWESRIVALCKLMQGERSVIDLGCGMQLLRNHLAPGVKYFPVDYVQRTDDTIVCDFNARQFPHIYAELAFISGCLEYVEDVPWFVGAVAAACGAVVLSYCSVEKHPEFQLRRSLAWVNDMKRQDVIDIFCEKGFCLCGEIESPLHELLRFQRKS